MTALSLVLDTPELAQQYEQTSADRQFKHGRGLIEALGVQAGERVLDVGSGTGLLAEHTANLVGPSGAVIGVEPLPLRVRIANKKQRDNLTFQVGDANDLSTFAAGSFDVVYLNAVFHWLPEKRGPLREFQRVLKQAGRLGISTGAKGRSGLRVIRKRVLSEAPFSRFVDAEHDIAHKVTEPELRGLLEESGFSVSSSELIEQVSHHATASAALDFAQASSFGNFWGSLPESLRSSAREALEAELEKTRAAEGIPLHGARLVVVAVKR